MAESVSLGTLEYEVDANFEKFEQKLREYEQSANAILRVLIEPDAASLAELGAKIQAAIPPIRVTLDTSGAESQMAALGMGGGGGGGVGGGGYVPAMNLGGFGGPGGAAPTPNSLSIMPLNPPSMGDIEAAAAYEQTAPLMAPPPDPAMRYAPADGGGGGTNVLANRFLMMMVVRDIFRGAGEMEHGYERLEQMDWQANGLPNDPIRTANSSVQSLRGITGMEGGNVGLGARLLHGYSGFKGDHPYLAGALGAVVPGLNLFNGDYDVTGVEHDVDTETERSREQDHQIAEARRARQIGIAAGTSQYGGGLLGGISDQLTRAKAGDELQEQLERIGEAANRMSAKLRQTADELEAAGDTKNAGIVRGGAGQVTELRNIERSQAVIDYTDRENDRAAAAQRDDASLQYGIDRQTARRIGLGGNQLGGAESAIESRYRRNVDSLDWYGDQADSLTQLRGFDLERQNDLEEAHRDDVLRGLRGPVAANARRNALDASTDAIHRGAGRFAGAFGNVVGIEGGANLGIDEGTVTGDFGQAFSAAQGGISQLRNLEAQISAGNRSQSVDPLYANLSGGGGGETARLLQDIRSAIDRLTSRLKGIGATD